MVKEYNRLPYRFRETFERKRERDIAESLKRYDTIVHPVGETLPEETRVYRLKVVTTMLKSGIPLSKINLFCDLLEQYGLSLTSASTTS